MSLDAFAPAHTRTIAPHLPAQPSGRTLVETTVAPVDAGTIVDLTQSRREAVYDVALVGLGYVGLPTALAFHASGCRVLGLDVNGQRISKIAAGCADLLESDRARLAAALADKDSFHLTTDPAALSSAKVVIIAVPTPVDEHLLPDLSILQAACETVVATAVKGQTLIVTSTTYVGCTRDFLVRPLARRGLRVGTDVHVAFSPERIDPGNGSHAHEEVPRVVGGVTPACSRAAAAAVARYVATVHIVSSPETAEMTKLLENSFRAVNIAFINEVADVSRRLGLDVSEVITAASTKPYGYTPFWPGAGVGGHCIPCDPHYLLWQLRKQRISTPIMESTMRGIAQRPLQVVDRAAELLATARIPLRGARVLLVGVAYKPDVEDVRESPALDVIEELHAAGANVSFYDPLVNELCLRDGTRLDGLHDPRAADVDLVIVHTVHTGQNLDWLPGTAIILDTTFRLRHETGRHLL